VSFSCLYSRIIFVLIAEFFSETVCTFLLILTESAAFVQINLENNRKGSGQFDKELPWLPSVAPGEAREPSGLYSNCRGASAVNALGATNR